MKKIAWNKYDCALLLEMLLRIENKEIDKKVAIRELSEAMRKQFERNGSTIDPTFRNQSGITLQYLSLLYVFSNGKKGLKKEASAQFKAIVDIYRNNRSEYLEILEEARTRLYGGASVENSRKVACFTSFSEDDFKRDHSGAYMKLKLIASVYDDPEGISIDRIFDYLNGEIPEDTLLKLLENVSWARKLEERKYTFSPRLTESVNNHDVVTPDFNKEKYISVLERRFSGGMRFDSIDLDNFRETYNDLYSEMIEFDDQVLKSQLQSCGFMFQNRLFSANGTINLAAKAAIISHIENSFLAGNQVIFYQSIYDDLSYELSYCFNLKNVEMFKEYLRYVLGDLYYFFDEYISKNSEIEVNVDKELNQLLKSSNKPLSYDEIFSGLSHISKDKICQSIRANKKVLKDEREHYFHFDTFELSQFEKDKIESIITEEINLDGFAIWNNVLSKIKDHMPIFLENNPYLSSLGIRNSLAMAFSNRFSFNANVISCVDSNLTNSDIFRVYAEHHDTFSADDIYNLSKILDAAINYSSIAETSIRVKKDLYVRKNMVNFNICEIDKAISTYLSSGVLPIKEIDSFLAFPNVGYEWNQFLLESYLLQYSKEYKLLNNGLSQSSVAGIVVKNDGSVNDFCSACSLVLAEQNAELNKDRALEFLVDQGLLNRKRYKDIEAAITGAKLIKLRRES